MDEQPAWVYKRDGRQAPFEADKISRALFAASEALGRPDAFLARELTDGVVHFLAEESAGGVPTTNQIAETVFKVVRELGQPALAEAFAEHGLRRPRKLAPPEAASPPARPEVVLRFPADAPAEAAFRECFRAYTLQAVFARDLVAAHHDGLLTLTGLEAPCELASCVVGPPVANPAEDGWVAAVEKARGFAGRFLVLDGPEHVLARTGRSGEDDARRFARDLAAAIRLAGLRAVVNLNASDPPPWADDRAGGPLFADQRRPPPPETLAALADSLARELSRPGPVRVDWHLSDRDFSADAGPRERLNRLTELAPAGGPVGFVFDRPRRPVPLAEGVDRGSPAVLLTVGLHLPRLAEQPGVGGDPPLFLKKLASLARLAMSAAAQKRDCLRRRERTLPPQGPAVSGGFLLDRARLVVAPVGLDAAVRSFTGAGMSEGGAALEFGKQVVQALRDVLRQDGGRAHLETCVDGPFDFRLDGAPAGDDVGRVAGLTPWDAAAPVKRQLRAAGVLHGAAGRGTLALFVPADATADQAADWLRAAWRQPDVTRVRLLPGSAGVPPALAR
jgi:hypothetical protein